MADLKNKENIINHSENLFYQLAKKVFNKLGSGHTEYIYHRALEIELKNKNIKYEFEKRVLISYTDDDGHKYTLGEERIDLFILDKNIIIELKAIINPPKETEYAQIRKYYRELKDVGITCKKGYIINFPQAGTKEAKKEIDFIEVIFQTS